MLRRAIGLVMLLFGLTGMGISVIGARVGRQVIDELGADLASSLQLVSESLDKLETSLLLAKTTLADVSEGLDSVETAMDNLAQSVDDTQPLLDRIAAITTDEVPASVESMQEAMPSMVQVAAIIDDTLTTLSEFRIERQVLGIDIQFDLGIDYSPALSFDESIQLVGDSLDALPGQLRGLKTNLDVTSDNFGILRQDLNEIASDLNDINGRVAETDSLVEEYLSLILKISDRMRQLRASIVSQLENARRAVTMFAIWMGLTQLAPLYLGWELVQGRRLR